MLPITAFISALTGLFSGSIPKIFELFEKKMSFAQELKIREIEQKNRMQDLEMQVRLAQVGASAKIEEATLEAVRAEIEANAQMTMAVMEAQAKPTGYALIDAINAAIRPFFFVGVLALFLIIILQVMLTTPEAMTAQAAAQFWVAVEGVAGWVAGYRSSAKLFNKDR